MLELDHMCEIGEEDAHSMCAVGLKGLQHLDFTFTPVTPKAILYFISEYTVNENTLVKTGYQNQLLKICFIDHGVHL